MFNSRYESQTATAHGFLVHARLSDKVDPEEIAEKLGSSLQWVEGVDDIDVTHMGQIDEYPAQGTDGE